MVPDLPEYKMAPSEIYVKPTSMQVVRMLPQILKYQPIPQWFGPADQTTVVLPLYWVLR